MSNVREIEDARLRPRPVRDVAPDGAGYSVSFYGCKHIVWFAIEPDPAFPYHCGACANEAIEEAVRILKSSDPHIAKDQSEARAGTLGLPEDLERPPVSHMDLFDGDEARDRGENLK